MLLSTTGTGASSYSNDADGNTLTGGGRTNTWDSQNRMVSCIITGNSSTFKYGADGLRRQKTTNGTTTDYAYDGTMMVREGVASDGVLRQSSEAINCRATAGDASWMDYTYHVQARKLAGKEGFLIAFHYQDDNNLIWWNLGGWGNTRTALERIQNGGNTQLGPNVPLTIETGRWYDIAVEVHGCRIRCFLDGNLIEAAEDTPAAPPPLYAAASRDTKTGEVIVKVVNTSASVQQVQVHLQGARRVGKAAIGQVLSGDPKAVNTVAEPEKVAPQDMTITDAGPTFLHEFPAHSVTVLRLRAAK